MTAPPIAQTTSRFDIAFIGMCPSLVVVMLIVPTWLADELPIPSCQTDLNAPMIARAKACAPARDGDCLARGADSR
jgi:hypothetical protein